MTIQRWSEGDAALFHTRLEFAAEVHPYKRHIDPTLVIMLQAAEWLERFPVLQRMIKERIRQ